MLNSYWTSVLLVELKSTSSSQHWFHSPSQLSGHPGRRSAVFLVGLFFVFFGGGHFRWVFGCEWALGMRFEEDYQGLESCPRASCAFQQHCHFPGCIRLWKMWCVTLSLCSALSPSVSLSFTKWFRHWKTWLQGLAVISRSSLTCTSLLCSSAIWTIPGLCGRGVITSAVLQTVLCLFYNDLLRLSKKRVAGRCWPNYSCC